MFVTNSCTNFILVLLQIPLSKSRPMNSSSLSPHILIKRHFCRIFHAVALISQRRAHISLSVHNFVPIKWHKMRIRNIYTSTSSASTRMIYLYLLRRTHFAYENKSGPTPGCLSKQKRILALHES